MDLVFLRHGQTDWNLTGRLQGRTDVPLNSTGIEGAKLAGEILRKYRFDAVYCSPLSRTRQTLEYACPGASAIYDPRLLEWSFGPYEGKTFSKDWFADRWKLGCEREIGLELIEDVIDRAADFYNETKEKHANDRILVVSHGGFSGALYAVMYGVEKGESLSKYCLPNATPVLFREGQAPIILTEE